MMKRVVALGVLGVVGAIAACGGQTGPQGQQGQQGSKGDPGTAGSSTGANATPSISDIQPAGAFLARAAHVTISGYATSWTDATTVDFGAGIQVANVHAASPTALVADITVAKTAAAGPRDVTVNDKAGKTTYKQAFTIKPPATVTVQGSLAQGSIAIANIKLEDQSTPFDTTGTSNPLTGQVTYTNLALTAPAGVTATIQQASANLVSYLILTDVDAAASPSDLDLVSGPAGDTANDVEFPAAGALTVTARTATPLGADAFPGTIKTAYDSALCSYTAGSSAAIVDVAASSTVKGANPSFALLPKSGHFADLIGYFQPTSGGSSTTTLLPASGDEYYAIYWDNSGTTGAFSLGATATPPAATHATTANDGTKAGAVAATALPFVLTGGSLAATTSMDWVKVTVAAADAGKSLHIQTVGDALTDVAVTVYQTDGTTPVNSTPLESGGPVDGTVPVATAGTYYVVFAAGQLAFDATHGTYSGIVRIQ
jgi:hypothetical protein